MPVKKRAPFKVGAIKVRCSACGRSCGTVLEKTMCCSFVPKKPRGWCLYCGDDMPPKTKLAFCSVRCAGFYRHDALEEMSP